MPLPQDELPRLVREYVFAGHLEPAEGKYVTCSFVNRAESTSTFVVALIEMKQPSTGDLQRYLVSIDQETGEVLSAKPVKLAPEEVEAILADAGVGTLREYHKSVDGAYSISYRAAVNEDPEQQFMIQLRYSGNVQSIVAITMMIFQKNNAALPVPQPFPTSFRPECGLEVQVASFIQGRMGPELYLNLPYNMKTQIVKQIAQSFNALWTLDLPHPQNLIGRARFSTSPPSVSIESDHRKGFGGPWSSVSAFLKAWLQYCLVELQNQMQIDEYKAKYLPSIANFIEHELHTIPPEVNEIPVVLTHSDMGLHNMIFSDAPDPKLKAVIDWEMIDYHPFPVAVPMFIEALFSPNATPDTSSSANAEDASGLRNAFWDEIPRWKSLAETPAARIFHDYYKFGLYLKTEPVFPLNCSTAQRWESWRPSVEVVQAFLGRYGRRREGASEL